jgi:hypothetical protein
MPPYTVFCLLCNVFDLLRYISSHTSIEFSIELLHLQFPDSVISSPVTIRCVVHTRSVVPSKKQTVFGWHELCIIAVSRSKLLHYGRG